MHLVHTEEITGRAHLVIDCQRRPVRSRLLPCPLGGSRIQCRTRASAGSSRGRRESWQNPHHRRTPAVWTWENRWGGRNAQAIPRAATVDEVAIAVVCSDALDQELPLSLLALPQDAVFTVLGHCFHSAGCCRGGHGFDTG
jgi:hypothetical protein